MATIGANARKNISAIGLMAMLAAVQIYGANPIETQKTEKPNATVNAAEAMNVKRQREQNNPHYHPNQKLTVEQEERAANKDEIRRNDPFYNAARQQQLWRMGDAQVQMRKTEDKHHVMFDPQTRYRAALENALNLSPRKENNINQLDKKMREKEKKIRKILAAQTISPERKARLMQKTFGEVKIPSFGTFKMTPKTTQQAHLQRRQTRLFAVLRAQMEARKKATPTALPPSIFANVGRTS